jgi:signal transduction histidine kinase
VVRDLHDGAQQRFVHTIITRFVHAIITLELALRAFETDDEGGRALVAEALEHAKAANRELRELAHGLLPDVLTTRGLAAGVESIADGLHVPVDISVPDGRFPAEIEATAWWPRRSRTWRSTRTRGTRTWRPESRTAASLIDVSDGGLGGACADGNGLLDLRDLVVTLGGDLKLDRPRGGGTRIAVTLPSV